MGRIYGRCADLDLGAPAIEGRCVAPVVPDGWCRTIQCPAEAADDEGVYCAAHARRAAGKHGLREHPSVPLLAPKAGWPLAHVKLRRGGFATDLRTMGMAGDWLHQLGKDLRNAPNPQRYAASLAANRRLLAALPRRVMEQVLDDALRRLRGGVIAGEKVADAKMIQAVIAELAAMGGRAAA